MYGYYHCLVLTNTKFDVYPQGSLAEPKFASYKSNILATTN